MKKKDNSKLLQLAGRLLNLLASDAYAAGDGFEYLIVEEDIGACLDRLPLPQELKQIRGAIYQTKGQSAIKERALWLVTQRASLATRLSDDVALYILSCCNDANIIEQLAQRQDLSDEVMNAIGEATKTKIATRLPE